jgi:hypothetical protein
MHKEEAEEMMIGEGDVETVILEVIEEEVMLDVIVEIVDVITEM